MSALDPPRGPLAPEVEAAARAIHREVWGIPYRKNQGPMHHAAGCYWRRRLMILASRWEMMAGAARICARTLPDDERGSDA